VEIRVSDNGPGIAADLQNRIFEPFFTTKSKGLGIGLALSRRILEALSGSLSAEAGVNGGSVFIVSLPRVAAVSSDGEYE
jgi:signal transduction histidine kinase